MILDNIVLLVTGCIAPADDQKLYLNNVNIRLNQYIDSILYYIEQSRFKKIVFCENSNYTLDTSIIDEASVKLGKKFEYITFLGNRDLITRYKNKGCGEDEITTYAVNNSLLLRDNDYFFKITGRLKILNINQILEGLDLDGTYFNRNIYGVYKSLDTRFYLINKKKYLNEISGCYERCGDYSIDYEKAFYQLVRNYHCFRNYPLVNGVSGGSGRNYSLNNGYQFRIFDTFCQLRIFNTLYFFLHIYIKVFRRLKLFRE